jgi:RNA polymerase sigma-70 factor (ECF subfamily)
MSLLSLRRIPVARPQLESRPLCRTELDFESVYHENLRFVWRAARRLGIDSGDTDDVVQEVFVVAYRRLAEFEGRAQVKTWLFKILTRVVHHHFRARKRKPGHCPADSLKDLDRLRDQQARGPVEAAERADSVRILDSLLARMDSDKREVFVLSEIEQLSAVEIADVLAINVNTVYSRMRAARQEFERALAHFQTRELGGTP